MSIRVSINPKLRADFDNTPNEKRSKTELIRWWCNPFVVTNGERFNVRCLDGGAWDRSTLHASYDKLEEAVNHAKTLKENLSERRINEDNYRYSYGCMS
jgi:hypothetical protein